MPLVKVKTETPTGRLCPDGRVEVRLELACGHYEIRRALKSPLSFKGNRVDHECARAPAAVPASEENPAC